MLLDALVTVAAAIALIQWRIRETLVPLGALYVHAATAAGYLGVPDTSLEWGLLFVGTGFALLIFSLAVAYHLRRRGAPPAPL